MDFDDLFSEPVLTSAAPVGRKFQPKRKPPAKKASSVVTQPSVAETNKQDPVLVRTTPAQENDLSANKTDVSCTSEVAGVDDSVTENQTLDHQDLGAFCDNTTSVTSSKHIGSLDPVLATCTSSSCVDGSSNVVESTQEDAGISPVVSPDDLRDRSTMVANNSEGYCVLPDIPPGASPSAAGVTALASVTSSVEDQASFKYVISDNNDVLLEIENLETEGAGAFSSQEQVSANSGKRTYIFRPKPKLCDKGANVAESVVCPQGTPMVQTEAQNISKDDQVLENPCEPDLPTPRFDDTLPMDPLGDYLLNTNQVLEGPFVGSGSNVADLEAMRWSQNFSLHD